MSKPKRMSWFKMFNAVLESELWMKASDDVRLYSIGLWAMISECRNVRGVVSGDLAYKPGVGFTLDQLVAKLGIRASGVLPKQRLTAVLEDLEARHSIEWNRKTGVIRWLWWEDLQKTPEERKHERYNKKRRKGGSAKVSSGGQNKTTHNNQNDDGVERRAETMSVSVDTMIQDRTTPQNDLVKRLAKTTLQDVILDVISEGTKDVMLEGKGAATPKAPTAPAGATPAPPLPPFSFSPITFRSDYQQFFDGTLSDGCLREAEDLSKQLPGGYPELKERMVDEEGRNWWLFSEELWNELTPEEV